MSASTTVNPASQRFRSEARLVASTTAQTPSGSHAWIIWLATMLVGPSGASTATITGVMPALAVTARAVASVTVWTR